MIPNFNNIMKSKLTPELAEIVGIMMGDGSINNKHNYTYRITITLNFTKDDQYSDYLLNLFNNVFEIKLKKKYRINKNCIDLYYYSKRIVNYMINDLGLSISPKQNLIVPLYLKNNRGLLKFFLRGLFDTDGCITFQRSGKYEYVLIKYSTKFKSFANDIKNSLLELEINSFICIKSKIENKSYDVVIRNKQAIKFMSLIGSKNSRNLNKWK